MLGRILRALSCVALLVVLLPLGGCGPFWVDPYITVRESSLNWVAIHYYNMGRTPIRRIGVEIYGNGLVLVKKGSSELVSNDFAKRYKREDWSNIRTHRFTIDPKDAHDIFQNLVNFGLLDREKTGKASKRKVKLGDQSGNLTFVESGIAENDDVVVAGIHKLTDGAAVTVGKE